MPTDKELAAAYRLIGDEIELRGYRSVDSGTCRASADALDPPAPTYAAGTVAWVTDSMGDRWISVRANGGWQNRTNAEYGGYTGVVKVEPLRVLADDEIALKRVSIDAAFDARDYADAIDRCGHHLAAEILQACADARDAEAGDAK